ncbi:MAG: PA0069 family radical SAM protein [Candidatus Thiosymbion ectosymbiont of Robbea hypermnestra]|nr:PA0069 family radical SAM protein [Candidatus Thiosymbion ectosymbiont of Robbea hypermnestra]
MKEETRDKRHAPQRGRGAVSNPDSRYADQRREAVDDGWYAKAPGPVRTELAVDASRTVISRNRSPDLPFDRSLNPYRGCEHGCIYCYARPTHAWLGLSPGLDFERRLFYKPAAAEQLRRELARPGYRPATLVLGANTDPYQPIERRLRITRQVLTVLRDCRHPVAVTTKSALILRDLDLLGAMAADGCVAVQFSITTLDAGLARRLEPRAASPQRRLEVMRALARAGISVGVLVSPLIPGLTDQELERILEAAARAGASRAESLLLRLPLEVEGLFTDWLRVHCPERAGKVLSLIRQCRGGRLDDPRFGTRFTGAGPVADLLRQRFELAAGRLGLMRRGAGWEPDASRFRAPGPAGAQRSLFDHETEC